jgi:hypothetical protein
MSILNSSVVRNFNVEMRYAGIEDHVGNIEDAIDALEVMARGLDEWHGEGRGSGALRIVAERLREETAANMDILYPNKETV